MTSRTHAARTRKRFLEGTHRTVAPEATLARIAPLFPVVGLTRVADVTGLDGVGIPVCNAIRPNARSLSVSQGKGAGLMQARVSAAMESIELHHAERVALPALRASHRALGSARAVDPSLLALLPDPPRGLRRRELTWIEGADLTNGAPVLVPRDTVSCDLRVRAPSDGVFLSSSNGLASGNHRVEALLHGLCEAIERDATCLHEAASQGCAAEPGLLDLDTVTDPGCRWLLDRVEAAGLRAFAWAQFSDIDAPSFGCALCDEESGAGSVALPGGPLGAFQGYGCHPDPGVALSRAIAEAAQARLTYIAGARDDLYRDDYALIQARRSRQGWLSWLAGARPALRFDAVASLSGDDVAGDLARVLARVARAGFERVVAVDLTLPDLGIPVIRIVAPGLTEAAADGGPPASPRPARFARQRALARRLLRDGFAASAWV